MNESDMLLKRQFQSAGQICDLLQIHRNTLYRMIKARKFPRPIVIGGYRRWLETTVDEWIGAKIAESDQGDAD